jgi:Na+/H+-translocating membrane pyrophosphatase
MIPPGAMVILPGILFGVAAVSGLLVASVQLSDSGGAWDSAKKYIERADPTSELQGKGSDIHKAAVVGDTVGHPFKDTSGPTTL